MAIYLTYKGPLGLARNPAGRRRLYDEARRLAAEGISVFPCNSSVACLIYSYNKIIGSVIMKLHSEVGCKITAERSIWLHLSAISYSSATDTAKRGCQQSQLTLLPQ